MNDNASTTEASSHGPETISGMFEPQQLREIEREYRAITMTRFPVETQIANTLAYIRPAAAPRIAGLTAHTGHTENNPLKRATDTGILMYELFYNGFDSPQGRTVVDKLNGMHHHWSIRNDDYIFVLGTFVVIGSQMIDRYGWRQLTDAERQVTVDFFRELGTRMGISDIPETYEDFVDTFEDYQHREMRASEAGRRLMEVGWQTVLTNLPEGLRPLARPVLATLTEEPARSALGMTAPRGALRVVVNAALLSRGIVGRVQDPESQTPAFVPGGSYEVYPDGYDLDEVGVGDQHVYAPPVL